MSTIVKSESTTRSATKSDPSAASAASAASASTESFSERDDLVDFFSYEDLTKTITNIMKHDDIVWMGNVGLCTLHNNVRYILRLNNSSVQVQFVSPFVQSFEWTYNHLIGEFSSTHPALAYHVTLTKSVSGPNVLFAATYFHFKSFVETLGKYLTTLQRFVNGDSMFESAPYLDGNDSVLTDDSSYIESEFSK